MELPVNHASTGIEETKACFPSGSDNPPQPLDNQPNDNTINHDTIVHTLYTPVNNSNPLSYSEPELALWNEYVNLAEHKIADEVKARAATSYLDVPILEYDHVSQIVGTDEYLAILSGGLIHTDQNRHLNCIQ